MATKALSRIATLANVISAVNQILSGKLNNTGAIDLATGSATQTTLSDARIGPGSVILLTPADANARAMTVSQGATAKGQATLEHAANTLARTYKYAVMS